MLTVFSMSHIGILGILVLIFHLGRSIGNTTILGNLVSISHLGNIGSIGNMNILYIIGRYWKTIIFSIFPNGKLGKSSERLEMNTSWKRTLHGNGKCWEINWKR